MKICFLSLNLYMHGGIQRVVPCILNTLVNTHDITVLMPYDEGKDQNIFQLSEKIKIVNLSKFPKHNKKTFLGALSLALWKINKKIGFLDFELFNPIASRIMFSKMQKKTLIQYFNDENFDVVIGITDYYSLLLGILSPDIKAATIGWQHNTFESYFDLRGKNSYGLKKLCKKEFANLDKLFVLTDIDRVKYYNYFLKPTVTMYNPVAFSKQETTPCVDKNIIFVGRLYQYQKGLDYLVAIMKSIVAKRENTKLTIVGDGPDRDKLRKMIKENALDNNVELIGMTSDVRKYYANASLFIHTSRYEGFGVVLLEALTFGLPVIAFHNNGPDEIISNGINGFLINQYDVDEFASKVVMLLENGELYKKMSSEAKLRAEDFSIEQIAKKFEDSIYELISGKGN